MLRRHATTQHAAPAEGITKSEALEITTGAEKHMEEHTASKDKEWLFQALVDFLKELEDQSITVDNLKELSLLPTSSKQTSRDRREKLIEKACKEKLPEKIANYVQWLLNSKVEGEEGIYSEETNDAHELLVWSLRVAQNYGHINSFNTPYARYVVEAGILTSVFQILTNETYISKVDNVSVYERIIKDCLGLTYILSNTGENRETFREIGAVENLVRYAKITDDYLQSKSVLILANIVNETEATCIEDEIGVTSVLIKFANSALESKDHLYKWKKGGRNYCFYLVDILVGLQKMSIIDANKNKIVQGGGLPLLDQCMKEGQDRVKMTAAKTVWSLAFDEGSRTALKESELHATLEVFLESDNKEIRKVVKGALWKLKEKVEKPLALTPKKNGHVMLSYSWAQQTLVQEICKMLWSQGYNVWMDIEQMSGSTLEAMAAAVEGASVVIIFISSAYKESASCRTEAEYTFQLRKPFVPIMIEKGYRPDGWLGMMLGAKLYIDFANAEFSACMERLFVEMERIGVSSENEGKRLTVNSSKSNKGKDVIKLKDWTEEDVKMWFEKNQVPYDEVVEKLGPLTGPMLVQLQHIQMKCPNYLYPSLEEKVSFNAMVRLTTALNTLDA